jgi:outer membrane protein TolC
VDAIQFLTAKWEAVQAANQYLTESNARNNTGLDTFLNVLVAQLSRLSYQETLIAFQTQQFVAGVQLVEALGRGWNLRQLHPTKKISKP